MEDDGQSQGSGSSRSFGSPVNRRRLPWRRASPRRRLRLRLRLEPPASAVPLGLTRRPPPYRIRPIGHSGYGRRPRRRPAPRWVRRPGRGWRCRRARPTGRRRRWRAYRIRPIGHSGYGRRPRRRPTSVAATGAGVAVSAGSSHGSTSSVAGVPVRPWVTVVGPASSSRVDRRRVAASLGREAGVVRGCGDRGGGGGVGGLVPRVDVIGRGRGVLLGLLGDGSPSERPAVVSSTAAGWSHGSGSVPDGSTFSAAGAGADAAGLVPGVGVVVWRARRWRVPGRRRRWGCRPTGRRRARRPVRPAPSSSTVGRRCSGRGGGVVPGVGVVGAGSAVGGAGAAAVGVSSHGSRLGGRRGRCLVLDGRRRSRGAAVAEPREQRAAARTAPRLDLVLATSSPRPQPRHRPAPDGPRRAASARRRRPRPPRPRPPPAWRSARRRS